MQILHFDIEPHNILIERDFIPKVSNFGHARLYLMDYNTMTLTVARGTLGYMAPELAYKNLGGISYKAYVYGFGKLVMEMARERKNFHDQLSEGLDIPMEEASEENRRIIKKVMIVALWCIQLNPSKCPSMHKLLEMPEGKVDDLQIPPKPLFYPTEIYDKMFSPRNNNTLD
ncbi:hypothetical protein EUGRSUZ_K00494 [Eucalyptus grandis]|uniref:Uncharacterized protein n=1 Tax=Eucalyptus grandis TaxID=71139 RepID=A0ACC3IR02_EUCGR|nr:hypothetical protein EUGRSUZ_K00494 [Eucalyptus grandis]